MSWKGPLGGDTASAKAERTVQGEARGSLCALEHRCLGGSVAGHYDAASPPDLNLVLLAMGSHPRLVSRIQALISERPRCSGIPGGGFYTREGMQGQWESLLCCFPMAPLSPFEKSHMDWWEGRPGALVREVPHTKALSLPCRKTKPWCFLGHLGAVRVASE